MAWVSTGPRVEIRTKRHGRSRNEGAEVITAITTPDTGYRAQCEARAEQELSGR